MKNLDQIRAANALEAGKKEYKGVNDGQVVKKIPTMIMENGTLGSLACARERKDNGVVKNEGHYGIWQEIIEHLSHKSIACLKQNCTPDQFITWLSQSPDVSAGRLRAITAETIAYLNYLRRFAKKGE